jgi:TonB-linked SusC/RagA family outer membrane protein
MKFFSRYGHPPGKENAYACIFLYRKDAALFKKIIMRIQLIALFLLISLMHVCASVDAQRISLSFNKTPLKTALTMIEKQSGYQFWYDNSVVEKANTVTADLKNVSLKQVLDKCFEGQPLSYEIIEKTIVIKQKSVSLLEKAIRTIKGIKISGIVTDEKGLPLSGVTVKLKGTSTGIITDSKGAYSIEVPDGKVILIFSSVGYYSQERYVVTTEQLNVILEATTSGLDEVKIIGYGTTTQRLTTGSVSKVSASDIERQPVSNPIAALQGRVPGLFITQANGLPGSAMNVQIRGRNSIQQGSLPLYIIDGIPFDSSNPTQGVAIGGLNVNNPFNSINPGDIESIEVLKDADATSIYGSRGANGVILITTKRPQAGSLNVSLDTYTSWSKVTRSLNLMNGEQYRAMRREAFKNDGVIPDMNNATDLLGMDTNIVNDWTKQLIGETAAMTNLQLRISGGSQNTQFTAGANYNHQGTVFPGDNAAGRKGLNLSINHSTTDKKFNVLLTSSYSYNKSNLIPVDLAESLNKAPYGMRLKDEEGNLVWNDGAQYYGNPLAFTHKEYNGYTDLLTSSIALGYKITPSLQIKANGGYNLLGFNENILAPISSFDPAQNLDGNAGFGNNTARSWSIEPQIEYNVTLKKSLKLAALLGGSFQESENSKNFLSGSGYKSDALIHSIAGASEVRSTNDYSLYRYNAFFGRLSLNWDDTYLLNATGRRDGSSRFGPGNQFANFGSIGVAWIFSKLGFLKSNFPALSHGKLRFSYGTAGNDQIGNYRYLDSYTANSNPYQQSLSLQPTRLYNKDYSWEQFRKLEAAIELGFFNDRLYLSTGYYQNRSDNQLISYSLPGQTGFSSVILNFPGKVENKGWEIELRSDIIRREAFTWASSFNISVPKNTLLAFPNLANSSLANSYVIGQPLSVVLGYQYLGVDPQTGIYKVADKNGDGSFTTADYAVLGNTDPKFFGGLQNSVRYREWSFDFLIQFVKQTGRHPIYASSAPIGGDGNLPQYVLNHWQKPGDIVPYAKYTQAFGTDLYNSYTLASMSGAALTDASYIRLKNASLTYSIPTKWIKALKLRSFSAYVECQNLFTITNYAGPDPEVQSIYILPPLRTIATGIKATF